MFEWLLVLLSLIVASVAIILVLGMQRKIHDNHAHVKELIDQLHLQQQSIRALISGANGVDRRLRRAEASEKILNDRQETYDNQQSADQPYSHAIRLVHQGAGVTRLVEELELSENEAELIVRLHGIKDSA